MDRSTLILRVIAQPVEKGESYLLSKSWGRARENCQEIRSSAVEEGDTARSQRTRGMDKSRTTL